MGTDDFLTREIRIAAEGVDDEVRDLIAISYHGYNEPHGIEPPAKYITLPDDPMETGALGAPTIVDVNAEPGSMARREMERTGVNVPLWVSYRGMLEKVGPLGLAWRSPEVLEPTCAFA